MSASLGIYVYRIDYSRFRPGSGADRISLILLVGAGRFERPTPCAQDRFRQTAKIVCFQLLLFQADVGTQLRIVGP